MRQERAPESDEAEVRVCESALSRAEEERPAAVCYLRAGRLGSGTGLRQGYQKKPASDILRSLDIR